MEIYQIKVFLEVARSLSFTEAADALKLTQPAVSIKIKSLETELGASLFHRLGRKIKLTEVGQALLEKGPKLLEFEDEILAKIKEIKQGKLGRLIIGCTSALADSWLPNLLFHYRQQYPGIQTQCQVFTSAELLYRAITSQQVDVGISDVCFDDFIEISAMVIDEIEYALLVASDHALAQENWLSLRELLNESWILPSLGSPERLVFEARLVELGLSLEDFNQIETADTPGLMRTYILQGDYLGFVSNFEFETDCQSGTMVSVRLQEFPLSGNVYLLTPQRLAQAIVTDAARIRRGNYNTNPLQKFVELVRTLRPQRSTGGRSLAASQTQSNAVPEPNQSLKGQPELPPAAALSKLKVISPMPLRFKSPNLTLHTPSSQRLNKMTLRIGIQNGTIPTVTAGLVLQRLGLLEHFLPQSGRYSSTQFQLSWRDFSTGAPIVEGLQNGQLDIGILGDYPLLLSALKHNSVPTTPQTRLVSFVSTNPDGSCNAMIVPQSSQFQSLEELRGHVIAVPFSSSAHGMVMRSLNSANLLEEVKLASLEAPTLKHLVDQPLIVADGYAHFAPFHEIACRQGQFRYLLHNSCEGMPSFHGVVVHHSLADNHPDLVIAYLKALMAAQYWYATTPSALSLISRWTQLDGEMISQMLGIAYQGDQPGRFFPEMTIRPDWIALHITQLAQVPGNEYLSQIDLNHWIQLEFLDQVRFTSGLS